MSAPDASAEQHEPAPVSGPNATPSVANVPISPPTETPEQNETDPAVAPLVAMFPDFDPAVLEAVYLSNNKDQNAAIEALLSMSNPEYQPSAEQVQADADEQLARQLEEEELSQAREAHAQAHAWRGQRQQVPQQQVPQQYVPQQPSSRAPGAGPAQTAPGGDVNFQEQFGKFAETGRKTFNTIFTKVKEKLKEFEQPPGSQQQPHGSSYGQYQQFPPSHQNPGPPQVGYTPMGSRPYPVTNPPAALPPATAPVRAYAPQAEGPAQSYLPEAPSTSPPKVTEQPTPKTPPIAAASASGSASSPSAADTNVAGSSGNRPSLDLSKAAFFAKKPTPLTERPVHNIDDDLTENPFEDHKP